MEEESFELQSGQSIKGFLFEFTEKRAGLSPGTHILKTSLQIEANDARLVRAGMVIVRQTTGKKYLAKDLYHSGVGILEVDLELCKENFSLGIGKF